MVFKKDLAINSNSSFIFDLEKIYIFHILGMNNGTTMEYPSSTSQNSRFHYGDSVHISCVPPGQSEICSLQNIDQSTENERLSESSESGIGEEQDSTPNNTTTGKNRPIAFKIDNS